MRPLRRLLALAVAVSASLLPLADPLASQPMASAATSESVDGSAEASGLLVEVVPGAAGRLIAGSDLSVTVRVTNATASTLPSGTASLRFEPEPISDRATLVDWLEPAEDGGSSATVALPGPVLAEVATPTLRPGSSRTVADLIVPAASLPFPAEGADLSVHRLSVTVDAGESAAVQRAAVAVDPGEPVPVTRLAVAMPLTVPATESGVIGSDDLVALTSAGGSLDLQLNQAAITQVALGIDPRIIASINLLGDQAPETVLDWFERLRALPNETFPLAYADSDISATSQAAGSVLAPISFDVDPGRFPAQTEPTSEVTPSASEEPPDPSLPDVPTQEELLDWEYSSTDIAWPRDDTVVTADLDVFAASGLTTTILSSTNTSPQSGPAPSVAAGAQAVLTSDALVSAGLRSAVAASDSFGRDAAIAEVTAALALTSAISGVESPAVFATLDRSVPIGQFPLSVTLAAITVDPWTSITSLADVRDEDPRTAVVIDRPVDQARLDRFFSMLVQEPELDAFSSALADPTPISRERRLSLLALGAQSWADADAQWQLAVDGYVARSDEILASVAVGSRTLTQASDNGDLPIVITNALDYPVSVNVNVRALRQIPILEIREPSVAVTVPANSQQRAPIPSSAIANGEVALEVSLTSPTGVPIGETTIVEVSVRAGWETAATTVLGILVVAVFILGIIRTVRRRRRLTGRDEPEAADQRTAPADARDASD